MTTDEAIEAMKTTIAECAAKLAAADFYMPAFATLLRISADEYADRFPDDTNGGRA